jgi:alpha-N-arabinofuranosidase
MANIAQMVNVLQAVILTEGEKMILTPTYHVFHMYKCHQDAELVESSIETETIGLEEKYMVPNLSESVSIGKDGKLHITISNLSVTQDYPVEANIVDFDVTDVSAEILTNEMHGMNTFEEPETVKTEKFEGIRVENGKICFTIPACAVMSITVE